MVNQAPADEQMICVKCGMCCDGTLFRFARLNPGERGNLPERIDERSYTEEGKDYFHLPCLYFVGKCSIYDSKKADVCSDYRCQLLKDLSEGKMTQEEAFKIVRQAIGMRDKLSEEYDLISGVNERKPFSQLLIEMDELRKRSEDDAFTKAMELLQSKCNILEALLIKHIRSASDFESIVETKG